MNSINLNQNQTIKTPNQNIKISNKNIKIQCNNDLSDDLTDDLERELELIISNKPIIDIKLSREQELIAQSKTNVIVDAVAGSGKTTTILYQSMMHPDKNILQITYNNMLKREVRKKVNRLCIQNMEIHTYHSLAVKYYDPIAFTDEEIKKIISTNKPIKTNVNEKNSTRPIDILFIDETQDMIMDYYNLIKKFISDTNSKPQFIILGDRYQGIYDFKGADIKFLTLGDKIWNCSFTKLNLSTSYRLTNQIAWFVNNVMLGYSRINTCKSGSPVDYYICNSYKIYKKIGKKLLNMINYENILPSDIFILVPSVKTIESPYKKLENYLVKKGIKCITPTSDDAKLDDKIISNKVVFTTYHQSKGRERKVVLLYNFDDSYTQYYNKEKINTKICPNILYVGATRASEKLILIQDFKSKPLDFINLSMLKSNSNINVHIIDTPSNLTNLTNSSNLTNPNKIMTKISDIKKINVTDLVKFITPASIDIIMGLVDNLFEEIIQGTNLIQIPNKIKIEYKNIIIWEDVSDLNGLVIPSILESKLNNSYCTIEIFVAEQIKDKLIWDDIKKYSGKIPEKCTKISDYLKIGNIYQSIQNKLLAKLAQIKKYNWLDSKMISECHKRMNMIGSDTIFEIPITFNQLENDYVEYIHDEYGKMHIKGRLDAIGKDSVWEFKCVDYLTLEHKLQLIVYYWLWNKAELTSKYGDKNFCLINIKSGQTLKLLNVNKNNYNYNYIIEQIIQLLFDEKYSKKKNIDDDEFIRLCNK